MQKRIHFLLLWIALHIADFVKSVDGLYDFNVGATTCYTCPSGTFADKPASAACTLSACQSGTYLANTTCLECPVGSFCLGTSDKLPVPKAALSAQQNVTGLKDFTCRRGYFHSQKRFCCNFNTIASDNVQDACNLCAPGFYFHALREECLP